MLSAQKTKNPFVRTETKPRAIEPPKSRFTKEEDPSHMSRLKARLIELTAIVLFTLTALKLIVMEAQELLHALRLV